jgi:hypothetical protein
MYFRVLGSVLATDFNIIPNENNKIFNTNYGFIPDGFL